MKLIFIRHCDPDYVRDDLTDKGIREAGLLAERIGRWDIAAAYCSPLGRARETARRGLSLTGKEAVTKDWLREFHGTVIDPHSGRERIPWDLLPGDWTREALYYHRDTWLDAPLMGTGSVPVREVYENAARELDLLLADHGYTRHGDLYRVERGNTDTLVFFCHLGISLALMGHMLGISPALLWHGIFLPPSSISVLTSEERVSGEAFFRCQAIGDTAHLLMGGEPVSPQGVFGEVFSL